MLNKKIIIILSITILLINAILPSIYAMEIDKANLIKDHSINTHIMYKPNGTWTKIKGGYICYVLDEKNIQLIVYLMEYMV